MENRFMQLSQIEGWRILVAAAKSALGDHGYQLARVPGRGKSNVWTISRSGKSLRASIRTSQDRWYAFPPLDGGKRWKTLDDVDTVIVASVDSKEDPRTVQVYMLPAKEVRERFNAAYAARVKSGQVPKNDFGMWVALFNDKRGLPASVGSGIADNHKPLASYSLDDLMNAAHGQSSSTDQSEIDDERADNQGDGIVTIADVMAWARRRVAEIAGVRVEAVKLDLKVEY